MARRLPSPRKRGEDGFTLVEALVALVILAVAAVGLIAAAEAHVDSIGALEGRAAAQWVAENRIAELTVGAGPTPQASDAVEMLGRSWAVEVVPGQSDDPELRAMTISVSRDGNAEPLVSMNFFLEQGRGAGQ